MKKNKESLYIGLFIFLSIFISSCKMYPDYDFENNIEPWKGQKGYYSGDRLVYFTVTDDIDFLYWTKSNGEVIYTGKNCVMNANDASNEKLSFAKRDDPYVFNFNNFEPGKYILNIHYKNIEINSDNDFRGSVEIIGKTYISDKEKWCTCGKPCAKHARFTIYNDSSLLLKNVLNKTGSGNIMNEFIYIDYDSNKNSYEYTYKTKIVFNNITLMPGESVNVLLPMSRDKDVKKNGFLLKKVINNGKSIYYGNTATGIYQFGFGSPMNGSVNNEFIPKGKGFYYSDWQVKH